MLVSRRLHISCSRNLYLDIRPVACMILECLLLTSWAVKILSSLVSNLILRSATYCKVYLLS